MGLFDKIKNIATKVKCATGFHAGTFTHIDGKPECFFEKTCQDCNKYVTKKNHKYSGWEDYKNPRSCFKERHCIHCDHKDTKEFHQGYIKKGHDDYCTVIEECRRCGHTRKGREEHTWVKMPGSYDDESVTYSCAICDKKEQRRKVKA